MNRYLPEHHYNTLALTLHQQQHLGVHVHIMKGLM